MSESYPNVQNQYFFGTMNAGAGRNSSKVGIYFKYKYNKETCLISQIEKDIFLYPTRFTESIRPLFFYIWSKD